MKEFKTVKYQSLYTPIRIYQVADMDTIISPYNIEYTLEWYNNEFNDEYTLDDIKEVKLYHEVPDRIKGIALERSFKSDAKEIMYWDQATQEEKEYLGSNIMVQPKHTELGIIKNIYGDIYTKRNFYFAVEKYKDIKEPEILCSTEW